MIFFFPLFFWWHCGSGGGRRISLIPGRDLRKIFYRSKHTNFPPSNVDLLYLPRTRTNTCEATAGRNWPGPAPREAELDQALNGAQWASLLATIFVLLPSPACLPFSGPFERGGFIALLAAQVSWTISLSNRLRLLNRGIIDPLRSEI